MKLKYLILIGVSGLVVSVDQLTKMLIYTQYHLGQSTTVIENFFNITYVRNYGAAFGFLANAPEFIRDKFFLIIPPLAFLLILYILKDIADDDRLQSICYSGIFAGALGNYIDRLHLGYVVDFLDFHYKGIWSYPAFNVADMSIVGGVAVLIYLTLTEKKRLTPTDPKAPSKVAEKKQLSA